MGGGTPVNQTEGVYDVAGRGQANVGLASTGKDRESILMDKTQMLNFDGFNSTRIYLKSAANIEPLVNITHLDCPMHLVEESLEK